MISLLLFNSFSESSFGRLWFCVPLTQSHWYKWPWSLSSTALTGCSSHSSGIFCASYFIPLPDSYTEVLTICLKPFINVYTTQMKNLVPLPKLVLHLTHPFSNAGRILFRDLSWRLMWGLKATLKCSFLLASFSELKVVNT